MIISKRYLIVPVSPYSQKKFLIFSDKNGIVMDYKVRLCTTEPEYYYYIDMRFFLGMDLEFRCEPETGFAPTFTDIVPTDNIYKEKFRPTAHFSASRGWINDPNGLFFHNGTYHMFYQHNPAGPDWGNMHWGHAVSNDLLHWREKEIAIFPDSLGTAYSGCAVVDFKNKTGLKENNNDIILLYYTACSAGMKLSARSKTTQCLAYSADGGVTFKKFKSNPIIPNIIGDNRDPKIVFSKEENCWYMALFLNKNEYALFTSDNLLDWKQVQSFSLPDDGECPDFYPLTTQKGNRYWVFTGAHDKYIVGKLEKGRFIPVQAPKNLHFGNKSYAAQTFFGLPEENRIRIAWNRASPPESYFNSSMCTPTKMTLSEEDDGGVYLCINPIKELDDIAKTCSPDRLSGKAQDISFNFNLCSDTNVAVSLLGFDFTLSSKEHCIRVKDLIIPLYDKAGKADVRVITDTTSVEIYANGGKAFGVFEHIADYDLNYIKTEIIEGRAKINILSKSLENIWR